MSDVLKRSEFFEYMQAFEQRLEARFTKIDERFTGVDRQLTNNDQQFKSIDQHFTSIDQHFTSIDQQFTSIDQQFKRIDQRFTSIDNRFDSLEQHMKVQFDETRGLIRLSLEAVDALRESTEQGFREVRAEHAEQTSLLKDAIRHVRGRVERVERRRK
jgi:chromosome segregation ATPase